MPPIRIGITRPAGAPDGLLALIGSIDGPEDLGERHEYHISQRMRERFGNSS